MKNLMMLSALCFVFAGCAAKSGGNVVGNGLTSGHPMNTMMEDEGTMEAGTCPMHKAGDPESEAHCNCGHKEHHKNRAKKAK